MAGSMDTNKIITSFIAVLVGVILVPVIAQVAADANVTGSLATILSLVPLLFTLGILLVTVRGMQ